MRGCRSRGAGSEARYLLRWHFFSLHRQYDAILQSDLDLEELPLTLTLAQTLTLALALTLALTLTLT